MTNRAGCGRLGVELGAEGEEVLNDEEDQGVCAEANREESMFQALSYLFVVLIIIVAVAYLIGKIKEESQ